MQQWKNNIYMYIVVGHMYMLYKYVWAYWMKRQALKSEISQCCKSCFSWFCCCCLPVKVNWNMYESQKFKYFIEKLFKISRVGMGYLSYNI